MPYGHLIAAAVMTLGVCQGHSSIASFSVFGQVGQEEQKLKRKPEPELVYAAILMNKWLCCGRGTARRACQ